MTVKPNGTPSTPAQLAMLSDALTRATRAALHGNDATVPAEDVQDIGEQLGKVILAHFEVGETDTEVLKAKALEQVLGPDL